MGLREKAGKYRQGDLETLIDELEKHFIGKVLKKPELKNIKDALNVKIAEMTSKLDRQLIDMQTLFEIGKELNSTLNVDDLLQIIIFSLMGHLQLSDVAILLIKDTRAEIIGKRGFNNLNSFELSNEFIQTLNEKETTYSLIDKDDLSYILEIIPKTSQQLLDSNVYEIIPMKGKEQLNGIIVIGAKYSQENYTKEEKKFSYTMASLAGISLENANLYDKLDKKYNELSALYEVSNVINSSDDYDLVLQLILETITTGFGVKKGLIFTFENEKYFINDLVGLPNELRGVELHLNEKEKSLMNNNEVIIKPLTGGLKNKIDGYLYELFIPLISVGTQVGGLIIFESDFYNISEKDKEIVNLFSIIASQVAPPVLITKLLKEEKEKVSDPFSPIITTMENEISSAEEFGMDITFAMLKLTNFNKFIELHGGESAYKKFDEMTIKINKILPENTEMIRYSSNKLLFILPAIPESDLDELKDTVLLASSQFFKDTAEIDIGLNLLTAKYPDDSKDKYSLLSLIE